MSTGARFLSFSLSLSPVFAFFFFCLYVCFVFLCSLVLLCVELLFARSLARFCVRASLTVCACVGLLRAPRRRKYDEQRGEIGGFGAVPYRVEVVQRIVHDGEVNRARAMPAKPNVLATKCVSGLVHVFDYTKHASEPDPAQLTAKPDLVCKGHTAEGYGLAWSPLKAGALLSGADDQVSGRVFQMRFVFALSSSLFVFVGVVFTL